jgi:hypothetical protein
MIGSVHLKKDIFQIYLHDPSQKSLVGIVGIVGILGEIVQKPMLSDLFIVLPLHIPT